MEILPSFERGEVLRAEKFRALVGAVRELLVGAGLLGAAVRSCRRRRSFAVAGAAVARDGADGGAVAVAGEWLWAVGDFVRVVPGGAVAGVAEALALAGDYGAAVGLHGDVEMVEHGRGVYGLEATGQELAAGVWLDYEPEEDGLLPPEAVHGEMVAGCVLGAEGVLRQRQRAVRMWMLPQWPMVVFRGVNNRREDGVDVHGLTGLLPCPDCRQVVSIFSGGYYPGNDHMQEFVRVWHRWHGRLDVHGQLHFAAENLSEE